MDEKTLTIQLKGAVADDEHVRLSDFIEELATIKEILTDLDRQISGSQLPVTDFRIIDLSHSSPSRVVLEAVPLDDKHGIEVIDKFFSGLQQIREGSAPEEFDSVLLGKFARIGRGLRKHLTEVVFTRDNSSVGIGRTFEAQVISIIGEDEISDGSVTGTLEMINFHGGVNKFNVYPTVGPQKVTCHFPSGLLEQAIKSVNRYINVTGKLKYKKRDKFPYAIDVLEIEIYPNEGELPTIFDLRGIAPNATGGLTSGAFVRRLRNAER